MLKMKTPVEHYTPLYVSLTAALIQRAKEGLMFERLSEAMGLTIYPYDGYFKMIRAFRVERKSELRELSKLLRRVGIKSKHLQYEIDCFEPVSSRNFYNDMARRVHKKVDEADLEPLPLKTCAVCIDPIDWVLKDGRVESPTKYAKRRFCSRDCAAIAAKVLREENKERESQDAT